jgi:hypothetical protein
MQQVQLFIKDQDNVYQRIELFQDETISLTQSIQNIRDISKVFTDFTKTFTIPASKKTNKLFKHYYNFDINNGFDARIKTDGLIKLNGIDFKAGKIRLEGVDLKENKAHSYRVTFLGNLVNLKDLLGDDKLDSLTYLNEFSLEYSTTEIKNHLTSNNNVTVGSETYTNPIISPLITHTKPLYYKSNANTGSDGNLWYHPGGGNPHSHGVLWSDLKYAIRIYSILRAIEEKYSINFSGGFFESSNTLLDNLYMWLQRKSGSFETGIEGDLYSKYVDNWELDNNILSFTPTGVPMILEGTSTGVDARNIDTNTKEVDGYAYKLSITPQPADAGIPYDVIIYKDGVEHYKETSITGSFNSNWQDAPIIRSDGFITMELRSKDTMTFSNVYWSWTYNIGDTLYTNLSRDNDTTGNVTILATAEFNITQQIPEIKVIDFLTGLFKMFNLTAYIEPNGSIKVQPLDDYYIEDTIDITKYVDISSSKSDVALPFKNVDFKYEGNQTILADKYKQLENKYFGQEEYKGDSDLRWVGKDYEVKLPFEHLMYERLIDQTTGGQLDPIYGLMVDNNLNPIKGKPLVFFSQLISGDPGDITDISFRDNETTHSPIDSYFIPSNNQNIYNLSLQSIHFSAERSEYYGGQLLNSLFETYYKNYIQSVFQINKRLVKKKCFLPTNILTKENILSYVVIDSGKRYRINSITTNLQTGESDIELLNEI